MRSARCGRASTPTTCVALVGVRGETDGGRQRERRAEKERDRQPQTDPRTHNAALHVPLPARLQEIYAQHGSLEKTFKAVRAVSDAQTWVCGSCNKSLHCIPLCSTCGTKRPACPRPADATLFERFAQEVAGPSGASVVCPGLLADIDSFLEGSEDNAVAFIGGGPVKASAW